MTLRVSNPLPFVVLAPAPRLRTGIEVRVYDGANPATLLDILPWTRDRSWTDPLNDGGWGEFKIHTTNAKILEDPTLIEEGRLIRFRLDGIDRYTFRIESRDIEIVGDGDEATAWWKIGGPGVTASEPAAAVVYRAGGLTGNLERAFTLATPGEVIGPLFDEAQARGALTGMTRVFTDTADSEAAPWPETFDLRERAGTQLIEVLYRLAGMGVDFYVTPTLELRLFAERGVDRSFQTVNAAPVILRRAHNLSKGDVTIKAQISTHLLLEGPTTWEERSDGIAATRYGRREAYVSFANLDSADSITRASRAALDRVANPSRHFTYQVLPADGHRPYVDFDNGDWVLATNEEGTLERMRIRSLTVSEDAGGEPIYVVEVNSVEEELEERYQRWLKRMSDGTLGGVASDLASPPLDLQTSTAAQERVDQHNATASHPDELGDLSDVDTTGVAEDDLLQLDGDGIWRPHAASAHGSHGGGVTDEGTISFLARPAIVNAEDDHFDDAALDPKWLALSNHDMGVDLATMPGWLRASAGGGKLQAVNAGDWDLRTEVIHRSLSAAAFTLDGFVWGTSTNWSAGTFAMFGIGFNNSLTQMRLVFERFINGAFDSQYGQLNIDIGYDHLFLRLTKVGTTYAVEWSRTGHTWFRWMSTGSLGFTPTHYGLRASGAGSRFGFFVRV